MRARAHVLVTGKTQSGKTTLVRRLLSGTPRWVALDPEGDYDDLPGVTDCAAFAAGHGDPGPYLVDELRKLADPDAQVRLSLTSDRPEDHLAGAAALYALHDRVDTATTALVMEEAWKLATGQRVPRELRRVYFAGLKRGLWAVTVTQNLTQIPKQIRRGSEARVFLRLLSDVPKDVARGMADRDLERLDELETLERGSSTQARRDRGADDPGHYVTQPPDLDLEDAWRGNVEGKS